MVVGVTNAPGIADPSRQFGLAGCGQRSVFAIGARVAAVIDPAFFQQCLALAPGDSAAANLLKSCA